MLECITLELLFENDKSVIISCVYRAPGTDLDVFTDYIEELLKSLKNKSICLCGDINTDLLKYDKHHVTKEFMDLLFSYCLYHLYLIHISINLPAFPLYQPL